MREAVLYIVDGNQIIGYGHIARAKTLSSVFRKKGVEVVFLTKSNCPFVKDLEKEKNEVITVTSFDKHEVLTCIRKINKRVKISVILIDLVEKEFDSFDWIRQEINNSLIVTITLFLFDKNKRFEHLSFFPSPDEETVEVFNSRFGQVKLWTGHKFMTFREEFRNIENPVREYASKVLVTMGGADPAGITRNVVEALKEEPYEVTVILSPVSKYYNEVQDLIHETSKIALIEKTESIAKLMCDHDIMIINGGLTRYEACLVGTPFIAISLHSQQYSITEKITKNGAGINLGIYNKLQSSDIKISVRRLLGDFELRKSISQKMQRLFDLNGAERIVDEIESHLAKYSYEKNV